MYLVSSQTRTFSQPSGGSLWKQQLLLGPGEEEMSKGRERSASLWEENGDRRHVSAPSVNPENNRQKSVSRSDICLWGNVHILFIETTD